MILQNEAQCAKCGEIIWSAHRHDFVRCKCGSIAVDGGQAYLKRVGYPELFIDRSLEIDDTVYKKLVEQVKWAKETGRNELGLICAIFRTLRDEGLLAEKLYPDSPVELNLTK
jgi:hypothetical protein